MLHMHRSASSLPCPYSPRPTLLTFFPSQLCFNLRARKEQKLSVSCDFSCFQSGGWPVEPSGPKLSWPLGLKDSEFSLKRIIMLELKSSGFCEGVGHGGGYDRARPGYNNHCTKEDDSDGARDHDSIPWLLCMAKPSELAIKTRIRF
ncbi:unnamed protein product [Cuscuta campestris]|uniref:Uncharacterized protein n=1 Tax=Cuscuta campestris TaxID=132261 RepID=A0A484LD89_9ASTE|nr:unnamed protein product [Cuscuta campestris]